MKAYLKFGFTLLIAGLTAPHPAHAVDPIQSPTKSNFQKRITAVSIAGDRFHINGKPTYEGRQWNGKPVEGLLLNSRMVQATFDDRNPETTSRWAYPGVLKNWYCSGNVFAQLLFLWSWS